MSFFGEATGAAAIPLGLARLAALDLGVEFHRYFGVVRADSDALRDEAYAMRHRVWCEELGFATPRDDGRDVDEFDARADHVLVASLDGDRHVACARIVLTGISAGGEPLPIELAAGSALGARWGNLRRSRRIGELSRLAVVAEYRRRKGEASREFALGEADFGTLARPRFPFIPVALCLAGIVVARERGLDLLALLAEPQVATQLARLGLQLQQVGGPVQHQGTRVPLALDTSTAASDMRGFLVPLYRAIEADLAERRPG